MINVKALLIIILWIAIVLITATFCRNKFPNQQELSRKIVHIGTGPVIPLAWWIGIPAGLAIAVSSIITLGLLINHQLRFIPAMEDVPRQTYGTIAYGLSITILLILFWSQNPAAVSIGVLTMAFGDGLAGLIGRQVKSPSWTILNQRKSIAGTLTMAITGSILLVLITTLSGQHLEPLQIIGITSLAVSLEQISPWGIDNLTVPIGVASVWALMAGT